MSISDEIQAFSQNHADRRVCVFDVQTDMQEGNLLRLQGRVLEQSVLEALCQKLSEKNPSIQVNCSGVQVLRKPENRVLTVATNLTSLHAEPSWLAEQVSQLLFGWQLEVLEEKGRWAFVRQADGYLGWAYLPFLHDEPALLPSHLVIAPVSRMTAEASLDSRPVSRVLGGTAVKVVEMHKGWAKIAAHHIGWIPAEDLRSLDQLPQDDETRRKQVVVDAFQYYGVQYLWGGCTAHGIDCSGLAQLAHRLSGITLPRDADMQFHAGKPVDFPYQPGDLLFFGEVNDKRSITHVAISLGGWEIIHSSRSNNGVYTDNVQAVPHLRDSFIGAATFIG